MIVVVQLWLSRLAIISMCEKGMGGKCVFGVIDEKMSHQWLERIDIVVPFSYPQLPVPFIDQS